MLEDGRLLLDAKAASASVLKPPLPGEQGPSLQPEEQRDSTVLQEGGSGVLSDAHRAELNNEEEAQATYSEAIGHRLPQQEATWASVVSHEDGQ